MRTRRAATIQELRQAIDCLPRETKIAMLDGIRSNEIIVGAYTDGDGICPMLAAHRAGGRTSFVSFAHAWDRFAFRDARIGRARRATERELLILRTHLEASLLDDEGPVADLEAAISEHNALVARRPQRHFIPVVRVRPGDPDRAPQLRRVPGWSWLRVMRRYDEYERAISRLEAEREALRDQRSCEAAAAAQSPG
jgi:hypothetical protein